MKKFTVRRSKWRRGGSRHSEINKGFTYLLNPQGYMCCLGFACNQICKIPKKNLLNIAFPWEIANPKTTFVDSEGNSPDFVKKAVRINDSSSISDTVREARLTKLFADNGIKVTFKE